MFFFFFKQKTAYEVRISDWSSDVCSSDLHVPRRDDPFDRPRMRNPHHRSARDRGLVLNAHPHIVLTQHAGAERDEYLALMLIGVHGDRDVEDRKSTRLNSSH